jgi:hypothetical protein
MTARNAARKTPMHSHRSALFRSSAGECPSLEGHGRQPRKLVEGQLSMSSLKKCSKEKSYHTRSSTKYSSLLIQHTTKICSYGEGQAIQNPTSVTTTYIDLEDAPVAKFDFLYRSMGTTLVTTSGTDAWFAKFEL